MESTATAAKNPLRPLLALAWPIIVSRSTQVVIGLSDAVMVAPLGPDGLAATATGAFNTFLALILPMGMVFIVSSFASQLHGAGDETAARRYGWYGLGLALATQLLSMGLIPALRPALLHVGYSPSVRSLVGDYLRIRLLSCGSAIGIEALANYYGGLGRTRLPMVVNVVLMVLNVGGNYALIGGHWGAPAMGVAGAALSNTLSTCALFVAFLGFFLVEGRTAGGVVPRGLALGELGRMVRFGLPSGLNWFFEFLAFNLFINIVVADLGTTTLAAFMAVFQVNSVAFMPALGLSSAGAILVGQAIGAGRRDDVPHVVRVTWQAAAGWQGLASLAYLLAPALLLGPFANAESRAAGFLVIGARMLRLSTAWQLFDATGITFGECLRAAGDTAFPMWARIVLAWLVFLPGAWWTVRVQGGREVGAVLWVVIYIAVLAAVLFARFRSGAWRRIALIEPAAPT